MNIPYRPRQYLTIGGFWAPENPKVLGSRITVCRPQPGPCPLGCKECYFNDGRYYEEVDVAHIPHPEWVRQEEKIVRMNDGNDSAVNKHLVTGVATLYDDVFFNTSGPDINFPGPVVLTELARDNALWLMDKRAVQRLMFVRVLVCAWEMPHVDRVIRHYTDNGIPVVLTFMRYHQIASIPMHYQLQYTRKKHVSNEYWDISRKAWDVCVARAKHASHDPDLVQTCGTPDSSACYQCGNCVRYYEDWREKYPVRVAENMKGSGYEV